MRSHLQLVLECGSTEVPPGNSVASVGIRREVAINIDPDLMLAHADDRLFQLERLVLDEDCYKDFVVADVRILYMGELAGKGASVSVFAKPGELPGAMFGPGNDTKFVEPMPVAGKGALISISVRNITMETSCFRAMLYGQEVPFAAA